MTAEEGKRKNLGRGLSALLGDEVEDYAELDKLRSSKTVPIEFLQPGRFQPRHAMDEVQINELAESIREKGILQPLLVRRLADQANVFEIIAGERRWRAAQRAKLHEVPIIIKDLSDQEALEVALVENLQRQDLSPLEEAEGYDRLMEEFSHTQENLAKAVGKSRSHVANMMRLLGLPDQVKKMLDEGSLSAGHARALLNVKDPQGLALKVVKEGLNVRQTEKLAQQNGARPAGKQAAKPTRKDADTRALEKDLANMLGLKVAINFKGKGGSITIHYSTLEQLDDILHRLSHGANVGPGKDAQA
ncbi:MAG: ParB/RepB/Spo0J family partition protein [Rhodospirillales bacterium]